ncbi:glycosyl transferase family 2 [Halothece sp. PCC 7418]|uniref:2'-O-glycosyltransferase CruG n=1 Tax=Halothece sp. (strain PCC 7418) TaxID=65093 RepID=UPI0002A087AD|nr:glycosyltransferase family 2 protein [Halothece sp. PCC 7418]AFZ42963.1 glycosyl transferase family 2 [Halothece sp. PCC 7418]
MTVNLEIAGLAGLFLLVLLQVPATLILLSRLLKGAKRLSPIQPKPSTPDQLGTVSIVVPTLNEADRITPCLKGLTQQGYEVREILIVDSYSTDGTPELVKTAQQHDPRFRLLNDDPLPPDWVGRPWALHNGFLASSEKSDWILGIDADTEPQSGLVAGVIATAEAEGYEILSLSPQFKLKSAGEWWLQPALLMTLLYRFDVAGVRPHPPERVMANGQCFLARREVLSTLGGYSAAKSSFCDDVTLARYAASQGYRVGFLDGAKVIKVRMYEGMRETWQEWGRSLDLKDASTPSLLLLELWLLLALQALPLPLFMGFLVGLLKGETSLMFLLMGGWNGGLLLMRLGLLFAVSPSYDRTSTSASWLFWLSPLADLAAVLRIFLSASQRPTQWRGRVY